MVIRTVLTYEDYAALLADGSRYEIHEGEPHWHRDRVLVLGERQRGEERFQRRREGSRV